MISDKDIERIRAASILDHLYNARQDGKLSDNELMSLLKYGSISQWTYERLLSLKASSEDDQDNDSPDLDELADEFEDDD